MPYVAQANLEGTIPMPQLPKSWDYRQAPPQPDYLPSFKEPVTIIELIFIINILSIYTSTFISEVTYSTLFSVY